MPTPTKRQEHTPTPWQLARTHPDPETRAGLLEIRPVHNDSTIEIAQLYCAPDGSQRHANAEFIVRAVNSHAQLIAALESVPVLPHPVNPNDEGRPCLCSHCQWIEQARQAIAQAKHD